ncbi:MAG: aldehyde dehydrogenase family protein [Acidimicrobiales bacterium]
MSPDVVAVDPRTGAVTHRLGADTSADQLATVLAAAAAASEALEDVPLPERVRALRHVAAAVGAATSLAELADQETALGPARLTGELARTAGQFRLFADVLEEGSLLDVTIDTRRSAEEPGGPRPDLRRMSLPIGPVAVFGASNFPLAFGAAGTDTASALAAGCAVIVKAHPLHPRTSEAAVVTVRAALVESGWPAASLQLVHGTEAGVRLLEDPRVRAGAFTGSLSGGRALFDIACRRPGPIPFYAELGSLNPVVVTPGAAQARGRELGLALGASIVTGVGQFCTKPGLVLVPPGEGSAALRVALAEVISAQPVGVMLGERLAKGFEAGNGHLSSLPGARQTARGAAPPGTDGFFGVASLWEVPAVTATARPGEVLDECFGPTAVVVEYDGTTELLDVLGAVEGSLTISLHAQPEEADLARELLRVARRRAGRVLGAGVPTGLAVTWATHHGGPWPATTAPLHTSVGAFAVRRFLRPVVYQDIDQALLPLELADDNPLGIMRRIDGQLTRHPVPAAPGAGPR